jgi:ribonuclease HI
VFEGETNNIAEFLGLVSAIKYLKDRNLQLVVYTDSITAISWVKNQKANTTAKTKGKLTSKLETWLEKVEEFLTQNKELMKKVKIIKLETKEWGEIPADFGRK